MSALQIVLGPPGTGKTTYLLGQVEQAIDAGIEPERIGFVTFTKKAAEVARTRAMKRFNLPASRLPWFRTLHSWGFGSLGLAKTAILDDFTEPAEQLGLKLRPNSIHPYEKGDQIYHLLGLAATTQQSLEYVYNTSRPSFPFAELKRAERHLLEYKQASNLIDYTDILYQYLEEGHPPHLELLLVDEAQDLSPIQWKMVFKLMSKAKRTIIAGDDDQTIYGWAGADTATLFRLVKDNKPIILDRSHRVPSSIQPVALGIISRIARRVRKTWYPREGSGTFMRLDSTYTPRLSKEGSYMILARSTYALIPYAQWLRAAGYRYTINDRPSFPPNVERAIQLWESYRETGRRDRHMAKLVRRWMSPANTEALLYNAVENPPPWEEALDLVSERMRLYRRAMREEQPSIRLSTIHRVKGDEADHVLLLTEMSRSATERIQLYGPEDEIRTFYVGATRARQTLCTVPGEDENSFPV